MPSSPRNLWRVVRGRGSGPAQGITLAVGNRDDGVIERRMDMRNTVYYLLGNLSFSCLFGLLCHCLSCLYINATNWDVATHEKQLTLLNETYLRIGLRGPLRVRAFVLVR